MAASNYQACLKETLKYEGGYVNDPRDPGGETNYGVTVAVARANGYSGPMRSIPMSVVESIYRNKYWRSPSGNCDILDAGVDLAVFDFAVHSGPSRAWKYLRGAIGGTAVETVKKLCAARMGFLRGLAVWKTYSKGFTSRMASVEAKSVAMALAGAGVVPAVVKKTLETEAGVAAQKSDKNKKAAGGVVATEVAKDGGAAQVDVSAFDWTAWIAFGVVTLILIVLAIVLLRKWNQHKERAAAYAAVAQEI